MNILVIGGANIDIYAVIPGIVKMKDSNIGHIYQTDGGVGRNILENLARLELKPRFVTAIGDDHNGQRMLDRLSLLGVECQALIVNGKTTPTYVAILDSDRDLLVGVNCMESLDCLNVHYLQKTPAIVSWIKEADIVVTDANLDITVYSYLINEMKKVLYVDAVSSAKAIKLLPFLSHIAALKCSRREAEAIAGKIVSDSGIENVGKMIIKKGVRELYLTDGANGNYLFTNNSIIHHRSYAAEIVSTSGSGDAFFAGVIFAKVYDEDPLKYGSAAAKITLESPLTNSIKLTPENLRQIVLSNQD